MRRVAGGCAFGAALAARRDGTCRAVAGSSEAARAVRRPQDDGMGRAGVVGVASSAARGARGRAQELPAAKAGTHVERVEAAGSGTSRRGSVRRGMASVCVRACGAQARTARGE